MIPQELLTEDIVKLNNLEHLKNRLGKVIALCERMGNYPLIYRAFNARQKDVILKVTSDKFSGSAVGLNEPTKQSLLKALHISNPIFCTMKPPKYVREFHGKSRFFIPPENYKVYWSPNIIDLGGNDVSEEYKDRYGMKITQFASGASMGILEPSRRVGEEMAHTYINSLPTKVVPNELIFDCDDYYLVDIEQFLQKFAGKKNRDIISFPEKERNGIKYQSLFAEIDKILFAAKFKTYKDLTWYLKNPMLNYIVWLLKTGKTI